MDGEVARALGLVKRLALEMSKTGHQIPSIPSSHGYQFVPQEYASLKPRSGLGPRGLRRRKQVEHNTAKGKHAPAEIISVAKTKG
eukprot:840710-Lingulodinium_polyedra.AAC.1